MTLSDLNRVLAPLQRRIFGVVARGIITGLRESEKGLQRLQAGFLADETLDGLDRVGQYGFASSPLDGAECVALFLGGSRDNGVVIGTEDRRYRIRTLARGEVALYTDEGDQIIFNRGKQIRVISGGQVSVSAPQVQITASSQVTIDSPQVMVTGSLTVGGNAAVTGAVSAQSVSATEGVAAATVAATTSVTAAGTSLTAVKAAYDIHKHTAPSGGGTTSATDTAV